MEDQIKPRSIMSDLSVSPVRSSGRKRQGAILAVTVATIAAIAAIAYFYLIPGKKTYILTEYETAVVTRGDLRKTTQASGTVSIPVQMTVTAPSAGTDKYAYAESVYVLEGDTVEKGQLLAKLSVPDLVTELTDLESDLEDAELGLEQLVAQHTYSVRKSVREIERQKSSVADARKEVERQSQLVAINASRKSDLETAQTTLENLEASLNESEMTLSENRELFRLDERAKAAAIARTKTRIGRLKEEISLANVKSPMRGEVLEAESKLSVPGSVIATGSTLFTIADRSSAIVELEVPEQYSGLLTRGQAVSLTIGGRTLGGTIDAIGKVATMSSDGLSATVKVKVIPDAGSDLLSGSSVVSELQLGSITGALTMPRGPYLTTGGQKYAYVVRGSEAHRVKVTFGEIQSGMVQIQSGLSEGDTVITSGYQNYIEYETIILGGKK